MNIVVLGAGKTGRGFIGRLLTEAGCSFTLIDSDPVLTAALRDRGSYRISFFGGSRKPVLVSSSEAFHISEEAANASLMTADLVFISIGANNFPQAALLLARAISSGRDPNRRLLIVTAENAIEPAKKLRILLEEQLGRGLPGKMRITVTESVIFCSTLEDSPSQVDILSEDYDELPFAADFPDFKAGVWVPGFMKPELQFSLLMKRKIFTYNCASAAIAYLGDLSGYSLYGDAAHDPRVVNVLELLYRDLNRVLCAEYGFSMESQKEFAAKSFSKFQNKAITDSIDRNARDARRKLAPDERMVGPLLLMEKHGIRSNALSLVTASAVLYGIRHDSTMQELLKKRGVEGLLLDVCSIGGDNSSRDLVAGFYQALESEIPLEDIVKQLA